MASYWESKKNEILTISNKRFKVERIESFRLPDAKNDSARWIFLRNKNKLYVIYIVNKNNKKLQSLEEINIDTSKRQWWRNYTAIKELKL